MRKADSVQAQKPSKTLLLLVLIVIVGGLFVGVFTFKSDIWASMSLGLLASFIASLAYAYVSKNLLDEGEAGSNDMVQATCSENIRIINDFSQKFHLHTECVALGIESITLKNNIHAAHDYWHALLSECNQNIDLLAHTLNPWFASDYHEEFRATLRDIAERGGRVRIIKFAPNTDACDKISRQTGENTSANAYNTSAELHLLYNSLSEDAKHHFHLFESDIYVPYMYIRTDKKIVVCHYFTTLSSNNSMVVEYGLASQMGGIYQADFNNFFNSFNRERQAIQKTTL